MRINKYIALATGKGRREADRLIKSGRITIDGRIADLGQDIDGQEIRLDGRRLIIDRSFTTIMLNKPTGYVVSRKGQGSKTIYELLPDKYSDLKPIGRLDKDSSGLLLLTNNGQMAEQLTHPSYQKIKVYLVQLNKPLSQKDQSQIEQGVSLEDGLSKMKLKKMEKSTQYLVTITEGRNRQIRRTFKFLDYEVVNLHRLQFGNYQLGKLASGRYTEI